LISDEDNQRVLNNAVYMSLFEEARCRYFGKPVLNLLPDSFQFPFVLHSTTVRFVAPGSGARENVKVYIKTTKISKSSLQQLYRVEHDGVIWCEASAILVGWNVKLKKKADFTDHFRQTVSMFEGITPDSPAPAKLPPANSTIVSTFFQKEKRALKVGDKASIVKTFTPADVSAFAELSEDRNPIHLDTAFAATTRFGKPIVHGALAVSLISALLGSTLPGEGTVRSWTVFCLGVKRFIRVFVFRCMCLRTLSSAPRFRWATRLKPKSSSRTSI
jgi:acyl-CoA thioesterase FadM